MGRKTQKAASIWDWCLVVLPITALVTFVVTLVTCNLVTNSGSFSGGFHPISDLRSDSTYVYFIVGFVLLFSQILLIILGRLQFLLQTQDLINHIILYIFHIVILVPFIFMFIVSFVSGGNRSDSSRHIIHGIFGSISLYFLFHTIAVFYLYIRRANGVQYTQIALPIWFLICNLIFLGSFGGWIEIKGVILGYIVAVIPFLYFLGFVPQFWIRARSRTRYSAVSRVGKVLDSFN